ncbi:MAG: hypothetical protein AB7R69_01535 [Candidatus Babeliales bacterium]
MATTKKYLILASLVLCFVGSTWWHLRSKSPFNNVLLIINYNFPYYQSIPFIKTIYKDYFPNIVFYGEKEHPNVHTLYQHYGALSYQVIADAMQRYPDYEGYLFCHDDCIMQPWQMLNADTKKIWFAKLMWLHRETGNPGNIELGLQAFPDWFWWKSEFGSTAMQKAYEQTPEQYKKMLAHNWGASNVVVAYSDIVYIPKQYRNDFMTLSGIYYKNKAFLETALPTIVSCLAPKESWHYMQGHAPDIKNTENQYRKDVIFNHPVKLSSFKNRAFIEEQFGKHA